MVMSVGGATVEPVLVGGGVVVVVVPESVVPDELLPPVLGFVPAGVLLQFPDVVEQAACADAVEVSPPPPQPRRDKEKIVQRVKVVFIPRLLC